MELRGIDFASFVAMHSPLRFAPPLKAPNSGAVRDWKLLQRLFELEDPRLFPALTIPPSAAARKVIARFIRNVDHLGDTTLMRERARLTISPPSSHSAEVVELDLPTRELQTSWAADFRRCYGAKEEAGFRKAHAILWQLSELEHEGVERRLNVLRAWGRAETELKGKSLDQLAIELFARRHKWTEPPPNMDPSSPESTISDYLYGEYLHTVDERADIVDSRRNATFDDAFHRYHFVEATMGLANVYLGLGVLARAALGLPLEV